MVEVVLAEPSELPRAQFRAAESLVQDAFGIDFRTQDWTHAVDGVHVMVTDNDVLVAHASVVPRNLWHGDKKFDAGYVEGVAVRADQQGRGLGRVVMDHVESVIRTRHQLGALNALEAAADFYAARGWQPWTGPTAGQGQSGLIDTYSDKDCIFVLPVQPTHLDPTTALICDWREGDLW